MDNLQRLDKALDEDSYFWLESNSPEVLAGIEEGVRAGATPADILRRVLRHTGREELARRCEQAARHVNRSLGKLSRQQIVEDFAKQAIFNEPVVPGAAKRKEPISATEQAERLKGQRREPIIDS